MSKRIAKYEFEQAANKLAAIAFDKKIKKAEEERKIFGDILINKYIPAPVLAVGKEFSDTFSSISRQLIVVRDENGEARRNEYVYSNKVNPLGSYKTFLISTGDFKKASSLCNKVSDLQSKKRAYIDNVTEALWQLRSKKRIEEQFPEALQFLNFDENKQLPMPQYAELRSLLKTEI